MSANTEASSRLDPVMWVIVVTIVMGGVYANAIYAAEPALYRFVAALVLAALAIGVALQTRAGKSAWELAREARTEVRRVVWPTRQETTQTTMIVVGVVAVVGLCLWGIDSLLSLGVRFVIG